MTINQHLAIEIYKTFRIHYKVVSIESVFNENLKFRIKHTNCVTYYDYVISCDVT